MLSSTIKGCPMYTFRSILRYGLCLSVLGVVTGAQAVADDAEPQAVEFGLSYAAGHSFGPFGAADGDSTSKQRLTINMRADLEQAWGWQGALESVLAHRRRGQT